MNAKFEFKNYEYILRYPRYGKIHTLAQHNTSFHYLTGILPTPTAGVFVHVCVCVCVCVRVCVCVCDLCTVCIRACLGITGQGVYVSLYRYISGVSRVCATAM